MATEFEMQEAMLTRARRRCRELEEEVEELGEAIENLEGDNAFWRGQYGGLRGKWDDKGELLKRIGELS